MSAAPVADGSGTERPRTSLGWFLMITRRCRIGWHKYVLKRNSESGAEGLWYKECRRCGKQKDMTRTSTFSASPGGGF